MRLSWRRVVLRATLVACVGISSACGVEFVKVHHPAELKPWEKVSLHAAGQTPIDGRLLFADANALFVLRDWQSVHLKQNVILSSRVEKALRAVGAQWSSVFDGQAVWSMEGVTVSHDTIVEDCRTVAALSDFVVRVPLSEDVSVGQYKVTMMSVLGTAIAFGIIAGLLLIAR